jgi:dihydrofolate synthase/folylpolyglutamate synthase
VSEFDARAWLDAHVNLESGIGAPAGRERGAPTLERIGVLMRYLGSPELEFPVIHLTGTNGKTSTARMISRLLVSFGLKVGSYTSPHLERVNERLGMDGEPVSDADLDELLYAVSLVESSVDVHPSFFEVLTAAAYRWFADEAVDVAVVEVGLGGTWDATNVVDAEVAVVTNVSIDHVEYLGPTREDIAAEKAGIVKPGATLVLGESDPDVVAPFLARAPAQVLERGRAFGVRGNELALGGRVVDLFTPAGAYDDIYVPLHGAYQADNAALALTAAEAFVGDGIPPDVVSDAFAGVTSPGRLEVVGRNPLLILDGAHNVAGAQAMRAALREEFASGPRTLVVGLLREKEPHEMLQALGVDDATLLVVCRPPSPRALDPALVAKAAVDLGMAEDQVEIVESVQEAVAEALVSTPEGGQVVVTGSLYVVGAARSLLMR